MKGNGLAILIVLSLLILTLLQPQAAFAGRAPQNENSPLGGNLHTMEEWSPEYTFANAFKQSGDWLTQTWSLWNTGESALLNYDADGYPTSFNLTNGETRQFMYVSTVMFHDIDGNYPSGQYIVLYDGEGKLNYAFDGAKDWGASTPGRDVVNVDAGKTWVGLMLQITETDPNGTGDYIRNIRVLPPNVSESDAEGIVFHPEFLNSVDTLKVLRFMDWMKTNWNASGPIRSADAVQVEPTRPVHDAEQSPYVVYPSAEMKTSRSLLEWDDRPKTSDARYTTDEGVPAEVMIALSNQLMASPWFNMPHLASDDYMQEFAMLVRETLAPELYVYVEYSNEVWNSSFYQSDWVEQQGNAMWPSSGKSDLENGLNWFGMRTAQMCDIWEAVFVDQPDRVQCVMATQAANPWIGQQMLNCPLWDEAPCSDHNIDAVAIAPYFGQHIGYPGYASQVEQWVFESDSGMTSIFTELRDGSKLPDLPFMSKTTLPDAIDNMQTYASLANSYGIDLIAYEGGQHLAGIGSTLWNANITELFGGANRYPDMSDLYEAYYQGWRDAGGTLFVHYSTLGVYSQYGNWGAKEYINQAGLTPKYDANETYIATSSCSWYTCEARIAPTAVQLHSAESSAPINSMSALLTMVLLTLVATTIRSLKLSKQA